MKEDKPTVLVVDDIPENIQVLLSSLKSDFSILTATSGEKAIAISLKEPQPDVILLDIIMPEMDGYEVCRRLKADKRTKDIPVIFVTVLGDGESELKGLEVGAVDYITKPINPELVKARVTNHVELKRYRDNLIDLLKEKEEVMIAQSRNASMGEMIQMIIHQWLQPLTTISTIASSQIVASLLDNEIDNKPLIKKMQNIDNAVKFLSGTIDDFRHFFAKNQKIESTELGDLVLKAKDLFGDSLETSGITMSIKDDSNILVKINSNALLHVYINLIKNAKDALIENREKERYINVTVSDDEENVITTFCDSAGGIDEGIIDKIFEAHFSTKDQKNGTGLGLYMSKIIVEKRLYGRISVENSIDGACFKVTIPKELKEKTMSDWNYTQ